MVLEVLAPYDWCFGPLNSMRIDHENNENCPGWRSETLNGYPFPILSDLFSCFSTITQMENWFNGYFDLLYENGFKLVVYRTYSLTNLDSGKQAVFRKNGSIKFQEFSTLSELKDWCINNHYKHLI